MQARYALALLIALAPLAQAGAGPRISTDSAPGVNFSAYHTYSWVDSPMPAGMNPINYQRIQSDIEAGLAQKGYQKAASGGDISLIMTLGAKDKTDVTSWGGGWGWGWRSWGGPHVDVWQYTEGQLSLDAFDTKTRQAVWHGQATDTISSKGMKPEKIDAAVAKLMDKFPATAALAAPPAAVPPSSSGSANPMH